MPSRSPHVTAADISRLAGVSRATVSNWRRRHADFPAPIGGTDASPAYDLDAVQAWLSERSKLRPASAADQLREQLRRLPADSGVARLVPLLLAAEQTSDGELSRLVELADEALADRAGGLATDSQLEGSGLSRVTYRASEATAIRHLLRCAQQDGVEGALSVLVEHSIPPGSTNSTPQWLADLMADLLTHALGSAPRSVLDPACGSGSLLVAATARGTSELYGQDLLPAHAALAAAAVRLSPGKAVIRVAVGDSIRHDAFVGLRVDGVLCAPPFGTRDWGQDDVAYDPRWVHGLPPKTEPELAWLQHCLAHLAPGGWAVLLMPPALAERASARRIRAALVRSGSLRCVIALPPGTAAPVHVGLHMWVLEQRPADMGSSPALLLMDAASGASDASDESGTRAAPDWEGLSLCILDVWRRFIDTTPQFGAVPGLARAIPAVDLLDDAVDLTPGRHIRALPPISSPDEFEKGSRSLQVQLIKSAEDLATRCQEQSWVGAGSQLRSWQTVAVADLLGGSALHVVSRAGADRTTTPTLQEGDVILPAILTEGAARARVVTGDPSEAAPSGNEHVLRPDPRRLDPWFLTGFLSSEENISAASTGSTVIRLDLKRLRVPLLPIEEQRRYGAAFRQLHELQEAANLAQRLAVQTVSTLRTGLTFGALLPPRIGPSLN